MQYTSKTCSSSDNVYPSDRSTSTKTAELIEKLKKMFVNNDLAKQLKKKKKIVDKLCFDGRSYHYDAETTETFLIVLSYLLDVYEGVKYCYIIYFTISKYVSHKLFTSCCNLSICKTIKRFEFESLNLTDELFEPFIEAIKGKKLPELNYFSVNTNRLDKKIVELIILFMDINKFPKFEEIVITNNALSEDSKKNIKSIISKKLKIKFKIVSNDKTIIKKLNKKK